MAERLNVNPTRMELRNLKRRLATAVKGHKMLKDKSDEMVRRFVELAKENKRLREEVEEELASALRGFALARACCEDHVIEEALAMPSSALKIKADTDNLMSVVVPKMSVEREEGGEEFPYSFAQVTAQLDDSILTVSRLASKMIELAQIEKTCNMLAIEIEKNRRRVNALEYVMIPQTEETIRFITMKLDENERAATVRLMKVKSMIENK